MEISINKIANKADDVSILDFWKDIGMITGIIFSLIMIICGIYYIMYDDNNNNYIIIKGKVIKNNCIKSKPFSNNIIYNRHHCSFVVGYKINGKTYTKELSRYRSSKLPYVTGRIIDLMVLKNNYDDVDIAKNDDSLIGTFFMCCAILIMMICYFNYFVKHKITLY